MDQIPFNKPYLTGDEVNFINEACQSGKISGHGIFTQKCQQFFQKRYNFKHCLLTTSCSDALEMAAILCNIQLGDEVIMPSYTFVSTANAFVLRGAKIIFADSRADHPGIDEKKVESLITSKTKVIVVVHYAGVACDMDIIMRIANKYNLLVVEDAAHSINSFYKGIPLGGIGHFGCFSFHETKNIQCGEGGMIIVNNDKDFKRAEIIWEKGTNRADFFRGNINHYEWIDVGSSFLPSEITSAFLYAQVLKIDQIQKKRVSIWSQYENELKPLAEKGFVKLPFIPDYASNNAHIFYLQCNNEEDRNSLISYLKERNISSLFHYLSLHRSPFQKKYTKEIKPLFFSEEYEKKLIRLPLYFELKAEDIKSITNCIKDFYGA